MFVRGVGRGRLFVGVIQIDTESSEDSEHIAAKLEVSYGAFHGEVAATFDEISTTYKNEIHVSAHHEGDRSTSRRLTSPIGSGCTG
jgi:hypothetical protein